MNFTNKSETSLVELDQKSIISCVCKSSSDKKVRKEEDIQYRKFTDIFTIQNKSNEKVNIIVKHSFSGNVKSLKPQPKENLY